MQGCDVVVAIALVAFDRNIAVLCKVGCRCTALETYAILSEEGPSLVDGFSSEASAFLEWVWLVVNGAAFTRTVILL